jgi:hypothetical protein
MPIDYDAATALVERTFLEVEDDLIRQAEPAIPDEIRDPFGRIFASATQAYREGLMGCAIARIQDKTINIRLPYIKQGPNAYNGRTLDERVVNPFLHAHRVPCSKAPFLSTFRRGIQFDEGTLRGVRDAGGYRAFLALVGYLERTTDDEALTEFIHYLLYKFARLREAADVPLSRLQRISLEQFETLLTSLLATPSGGLLPVVLVVAAFRTIKDYFALDWQIDYQGINVADAATGAGGDITITRGTNVVFAAEVTERPVGRARVAATFNTKIAPQAIEDYLFFVRPETLAEDARQQARQYFAQGHEVNFLEIKNWVLMALATMGRRGRDLFNGHLLAMIDDASVPRAVKVAWNDYIAALTDAPG